MNDTAPTGTTPLGGDLTAASTAAVAGRAPVPLGEFIKAPTGRRRWAVEGVWAEGASGLIAGSPKAGKSTLCMELAVSLATGCPFLGQADLAGQPLPARVTYIQAENSPERVRRDLDRILEARGLGFMEPVDDLYDLAGPPLGERFQPTWLTEPDLRILSNPGLDLTRADDRRWLLDEAVGRDYVFLDPLYLLAAVNANDTGEMMRALAGLSEVRTASGCALIFTHQQTDKSRSGSPASRLIGSTFMHGWYESAIFTERTSAGIFSLRCDNLREMGEERTIRLSGRGVGSWEAAGAAAVDAAGRSAPRVDAKEANIGRLKLLMTAQPDYTNEQYARALKASPASIKRWKRQIKGRSSPDE